MRRPVSGVGGQLGSQPEPLSQKGHEDAALIRKELRITGAQAVR